MKLEPIYLDAARRLLAGLSSSSSCVHFSLEKIRVKFAKINCEAEPKLCKDLGVNGYPDLKLCVDPWLYLITLALPGDTALTGLWEDLLRTSSSSADLFLCMFVQKSND